MACEQFYSFIPGTKHTVNSGSLGSISISSINGLPVTAQALIDNFGVTCPQLITLLPALFDTPDVAIVSTDTIINVTDFTVAAYAGTPPESLLVNFFVDGVQYGNVTATWDGLSVTMDYSALTWVGPIDMSIHNSVTWASYDTDVFETSINLAEVLDFSTFQIEDWIACAVPSCQVSPPSPPPFPPFLPPSVNWPNITPAPTPPTASFPPGQPPNLVLGIGANYSIFSNFGYKG